MFFENQANGTISIVFNILFFILMFFSIFYGSKIQGWKSSQSIKLGLEELQQWNADTRQLTISKFKEFAAKNVTVQEIEMRVDEFLSFVTITPVGLDPNGIIPKLEHILKNREARYLDEVKSMATTANDIQILNLGKLLEVAAAVHMVHRLLLHYYLLGKKTKSSIFLQQIDMQLSSLLIMAKAYVSASKSFAEGSPIGDALGPMVVAKLIRDIAQDVLPDYEEIVENTIVQKVPFEGRILYFVRAKGPGGTVGKTGTAIKNLLEQHSNEIVRIITIDAGIKFEGDKTGAIVSGVGAAMGGFGIEKSKIEEASTKTQVPLDALICRQSLGDAICTMKKSISDSVPLLIEKTKTLIRRNSEEHQSIIIAGIGNSIGIGI
jgi:hypothetical protein